jgi:hypothetical protein
MKATVVAAIALLSHFAYAAPRNGGISMLFGSGIC